MGGEEFDSKREARRYQELVLLQKAGEICDLKRQVKFILIPTQYETYERYGKRGQRLKDGRRLLEKECAYFADFQYRDTRTGKLVVEDAKGVRTDEYKIKRKLMLSVHNIKIREI